jgi:hypothetical protein
MAAERIWVPFAENHEENPFNFDLSAKSIEYAVRLCWLSMPVESRTLTRLDAKIRALVDEALREAREDASRHGVT